MVFLIYTAASSLHFFFSADTGKERPYEYKGAAHGKYEVMIMLHSVPFRFFCHAALMKVLRSAADDDAEGSAGQETEGANPSSVISMLPSSSSVFFCSDHNMQDGCVLCFPSVPLLRNRSRNRGGRVCIFPTVKNLHRCIFFAGRIVLLSFLCSFSVGSIVCKILLFPSSASSDDSKKKKANMAYNVTTFAML